jgi:hypothetical protein
MLTEKEKQFLVYWEQNREKEGSFSSKLLRGLPMSMLFTAPILLFIVVIRLFFPDWYTKISGTSAGTFITATFAVIIITLFYAFFRMHFKWENNEQVYKILQLKKERLNNENQNTDL